MTNSAETVLGKIDQDSGTHSDSGGQTSSSAAGALSYFALKVDGEWRGGWYRIQDGRLEVYAAGQVRTAYVGDTRSPVPLLRELVTDMVRARH